MLVIGCGEDSKTSEEAEREIRSTLRTYLDALGTGNGKVACSLSTPKLRFKRAESGRSSRSADSCEEFVSLVRDFPSDLRARLARGLQTARIEHVAIDGDRARVRIRILHPAERVPDRTPMLKLQRTDEGWRVDFTPGERLT